MSLSADDLLFLARRGRQRETKPALKPAPGTRITAKRRRFGFPSRKNQ